VAGVLSNAVAAAMRAVGSALPEIARTMSADGATGTVVLASSVDKGLAAATPAGANETRRFVAQVADFPNLTIETLAEIGGASFLITSLRETANAAWFFGVSDEMQKTPVEYFGTRRKGATVRRISAGFPALVAEGEREPTFADAAAMCSDVIWHIVIRKHDWPEVTRPDVGDAIAFDDDKENVRRTFNVANVKVHEGYYVLTVREG